MTELKQPHNHIANSELIDTLASLARTRQTKITAAELGVNPSTVRIRLMALNELAGGETCIRRSAYQTAEITPLGWELLEGFDIDNWLTTKEAEQASQLTQKQVIFLIETGKITATKQYGRWCIDRPKFEAFIETHDPAKTLSNGRSFQKRHKGYISTQEAMEIIGASGPTVIGDMIRRKELKAFKDGKFWYIEEASARELAKEYTPEEWRRRRGVEAAKQANENRLKHPSQQKRKKRVKPAKSFDEVRREMQRKHNKKLGVTV